MKIAHILLKVETPDDIEIDTLLRIVNASLNAGLSDAKDVADNPEDFDQAQVVEATNALDCEFHNPVFVGWQKSHFVYKRTIPCYVEYTTTITATSREEADERFYNSPPDPKVSIGDTISYLDEGLEVEELDEELGVEELDEKLEVEELNET